MSHSGNATEGVYSSATRAFSQVFSHRAVRRIGALALSSALLAACSEDKLLGTGGDTREFNAMVIKGPVSGSECRLLDAGGNGLSGAVTSDADGNVSFGDIATVGNGDLVYAQCVGGQYTDEATGATLNLPSGDGMRGGLKVEEDVITILVTPVTELAFREAESAGQLADLETYNSNVAQALGLGSGFDPGSTIPGSVPDAGTNPAGQYTAVLAMISQTQEEGELGADLGVVLDNLEICIDGATGTIDKTCAQSMLKAVASLPVNNRTGNEPTSDAEQELLDNLGAIEDTTDPQSFVVTEVLPYTLSYGANPGGANGLLVNGEDVDSIVAAFISDGSNNNVSCTVTSSSPSQITLDCSGMTIANTATGVVLELRNSSGNRIYYDNFALSSLPENTVSGLLATTVNRTYGDAAFTQTASCESGSPGYASGDTDIATVNASTGEVTILRAGSVAITATCAAVSNSYIEGVGSYTLSVATATPGLNAGADASVLIDVANGVFSQAATVSNFPAGCGTPDISYSITGDGYIGFDTDTGDVSIDTSITADKTAVITATLAAVSNKCDGTSDSYRLTIQALPENTPDFTDATVDITFGDSFNLYDNVTACADNSSDPSAFAVAGGVSSPLSYDNASGDATADQGTGTEVITITCPAVSGQYTQGTADYTVDIARAQPGLDASGDATVIATTTTYQQVATTVDYPSACGTPDISYDITGDGYTAINTSSGVVTIKTDITSDKTADITATLAASTYCDATSDSYRLTIQALPDNTPAFRDATVDIAYGDSFNLYDNVTACADNSSDPSAFTLGSALLLVPNASGDATADQGTGTEVITITCPASATHREATADYALVVGKAVPSLSFGLGVDGNGMETRNLVYTTTTDATSPMAELGDLVSGDTSSDLLANGGKIEYSLSAALAVPGSIAIDFNTGAITLSGNPINIDRTADIIATFTSGASGTSSYYADVSSSYRLHILEELPAAVYSMRNYVPGYGGGLIEVRRGEDDATADIGYDPSGDLDVAALYSFLAEPGVRNNLYTTATTRTALAPGVPWTSGTLSTSVVLNMRVLVQPDASGDLEDGLIFEKGGVGHGMAVYVHNGDLAVMAGDGSTDTGSGVFTLSAPLAPYHNQVIDLQIYLRVGGPAVIDIRNASAGDVSFDSVTPPSSVPAGITLLAGGSEGGYFLLPGAGLRALPDNVGDQLAPGIVPVAAVDGSDAMWIADGLLPGQGNVTAFSDDAYVTTWYDQSGNGMHLLQADPLAQPRIVIGGALVAENGKPSVEFSDPMDTQPQLLVSTATLPDSSNVFAFLAHKKTLLTDNPIVFNLNHGNNADNRVSANLPWSTGHIYWDAPGGSRTTAGGSSAIVPAVPYYNDLDMHQYTLTRTGVVNEQRIHRDGAELARGGLAGGNLQLNQISVGFHPIRSSGADMRLSEMVVYLQNMFADMAAIEADQKAWWGTP